MIDVEVAVTIRRPRRDVAAVMFNPRYDTAWIGGVSRVRPSPPGPPGRWRFVVPAINPLHRRAVIRDLGRLKSLLPSGGWRGVAA
ncbi:MAG TPA: hypothetical protein VND19_09640 [Acetobacteraceae bacterium]|nr:hypothetical protein [Acetobacteraceae bacterium]